MTLSYQRWVASPDSTARATPVSPTGSAGSKLSTTRLVSIASSVALLTSAPARKGEHTRGDEHAGDIVPVQPPQPVFQPSIPPLSPRTRVLDQLLAYGDPGRALATGKHANRRRVVIRVPVRVFDDRCQRLLNLGRRAIDVDLFGRNRRRGEDSW